MLFNTREPNSGLSMSCGRSPDLRIYKGTFAWYSYMKDLSLAYDTHSLKEERLFVFFLSCEVVEHDSSMKVDLF